MSDMLSFLTVQIVDEIGKEKKKKKGGINYLVLLKQFFD